MTMLDFWDWVDQEIDARGLSYYRIEQDAGLANAAVSRPARNRSQPTLTVCRAIADAFGLRDVTVLRKAGLIESVPGTVEEEELAIQIIRALSPTARRAALAMLNGLRRADERDAQAEWDRRTTARQPEPYVYRQPHSALFEVETWFQQQLALLPPDAPDLDVRRIVVETVARVWDEGTDAERAFLARLFEAFASMKREERQRRADCEEQPASVGD